MNLAGSEGFRSDQGMTGQELAAKADHIAVKSSTGAMADLFEGHSFKRFVVTP
jgi:hypothetical protein